MADSNNQLFLLWLEEWYDQAALAGSKAQHVYKRSLDSLKASPVTFVHPDEMLNLKGFGPGTCSKLKKKLKEYCVANGQDMPVPLANPVADLSATAPKARAKKTNKPKPYVPQYRTGAYAILLVLHQHNIDPTSRNSSLSKADIIRRAQPLCDSSFEIPAGTNKDQSVGGTSQGYCTAWSGVKMLIKHELVIELGKRPRITYQISQDGIQTAESILKVERAQDRSSLSSSPPRQELFAPVPVPVRTPPEKAIPRQTKTQFKPTVDSESDSGLPAGLATVLSDKRQETSRPVRTTATYMSTSVIASLPTAPTAPDLPQFTPEIWTPGSFKVSVIIDSREIYSNKDRTFFETKLNEYDGVRAAVRPLGIGDSLWIATNNATGEEVVLEHIAERKRLDDLMQSIKDGRFFEQKFRLMRTGLRSVVYIVEEAPGVDISTFVESIQTAISSTQVVDGFFLKRTAGIEETVKYLARLTRKIATTYEKKTLYVIPDSAVERQTYLHLITHLHATDPGTSYHISFDKFQVVGSKSGNLTVRDVYLRMLLTIRGVSWEKALEIQKVFATPEALWAELEKTCREQGEAAARELVGNACARGASVARKRIGPALSSRIAEIWGPVPHSGNGRDD
ncbi:hypothetical protein V1512DRAFT_257749 [Lipomyces arxii]|uniref:uncharacterized protein n=1 Tax=Lipomyces arxii TaxID=56418 RepID=UPI0034CDF600